MRKPAFRICENKGADQNRAADGLCFRYMDSTIPLLPKSTILSLQTFSVVVQPGLFWTWSETPKTGFLMTWLILCYQVLKDASVLESIGFYAIHLLSQALITPSQWKVGHHYKYKPMQYTAIFHG